MYSFGLINKYYYLPNVEATDICRAAHKQKHYKYITISNLMNELFNVDYVGFDLDNTLYPLNPEIDERISMKVAEGLLEIRSDLGDINSARELLERMYKELGTRTLVFSRLGVKNPGELMERCLIESRAEELISPDSRLVEILTDISKRYRTFLLTASPKKVAIPRLHKIGIEPDTFNFTIYGDNPSGAVKRDGSIYRHLLDVTGCPPESHVYIGDSLKADIIPAKNSGMKTILVGSKDENADISINSIHEIENLLL